MLNQQIYQVTPGRPFADGSTVDSISADPCARAAVSGANLAAQNLLNVTDKQGTFNDGDLVVIKQERDSSDQENFEVNYIVSGAATGTFTLLNNLGRDYTSQTGSTSALRAQVVQVKKYAGLDLSDFNGTGWRATQDYATNGWGGVICIAVNGILTISGTPKLNGAPGWSSSTDHNTSSIADYFEHANTVGGGMRGGWNSTDSGTAGVGEGYLGDYGIEQANAVNNAGGGAANFGGGGGGYRTNGGSGDFNGGSSIGDAPLTHLWLGAGGGGGKNNGGSASSGGGGGGNFLIWARRIVVTGGLQVNGGNGGSGGNPSGGGSGGGIILNFETADLGSGLVQALGGTKGGANAGDGGSGGIRLNYGGSYVGSTNPGESAARDPFLIVPSPIAAFL